MLKSFRLYSRLKSQASAPTRVHSNRAVRQATVDPFMIFVPPPTPGVGRGALSRQLLEKRPVFGQPLSSVAGLAIRGILQAIQLRHFLSTLSDALD